MSNLNALVVGASIGGLTVARCLQRIGYHVRVVDKQENFEKIVKNDIGVCIYPDALKVLGYLGVGNTILKNFKKAGHSYRTINSEFLSGKLKTKGNVEGDIILCKKSDLLRILHDEKLNFDTPLEIAYKKKLICVERFGERGILNLQSKQIKNEKIKSEFSDNEVYHSDLLIAADGMYSSVRRIVAPSTLRANFIYSGFRTVSGIVQVLEQSDFLLDSFYGIQEFIFDDCKMILFPLDAGKIHFSLTFFEKEKNLKDCNRETCLKLDSKLCELLIQKFAHIGNYKLTIQKILNAAIEQQIYIRNEYNFEDCENCFYKSRVAFLGAAAQASFSTCIYQTTKSILDAWEMSNCLSDLTNEAKIEIFLRNILNKGIKENYFEKYFVSIPSKKKKHIIDIETSLKKYMDKRINHNDLVRSLSCKVFWLLSNKSKFFRDMCLYLPYGIRNIIFRMFAYTVCKKISPPPLHFQFD